jgi:lysophospholipase L1-like esterase
VHGASVAFGAYASGIATTYFHVLGTELERLQTPADVIVLATGMWRSAQELAALELQGCQEKPDVVVFLDGLNDIGLDSYRPYEDKIASYLANMRRAAEIASASDADLLIVLQPSLAERTRRTPVEETLLKHTLEPTHQSEETLRQFYAEARAGLKALAQRPRVRFFDASQLFEGEEATTFADLWHFSDFGHEILGRALARELAPLLKRRLEPAGRTVH